MTDPELVTKVLEACGWKLPPDFDGNEYTWIESPLGAPHIFKQAMSILTSRDACWDVLPMKDIKFMQFIWMDSAHQDHEILIHLTGKDWCLAFLKWKGVEI